MGAEFLQELKACLDDSCYPEQLTKTCELMECLSHKEGCETLLARRRDTGELCVAKCYEARHPLFSVTEPPALKSLSCPGLPAFIAEYKNSTMRCILREYIEGETLDQVAAHAPVPAETVRTVGIRLCDILICLHGQDPPIIHRDIKPQNVVLDGDGNVSLIDFGISRLYASNERRADTVAFGTAAFAPPEQYGFSQTDRRSDIFSLGVLLHWLLTGNTDLTKCKNSPLEKIAARCTAFDPNDRYPDASAVKRALFRSGPETRRRRIWFLTVASLVLLTITLCTALWRHSGPPAKDAARVPAFFASNDAPQPSDAGFIEPLMEQAVRAALHKGPDDPLPAEDLASVTELYIVAGKALPSEDAFYAAVADWDTAEDKPRGEIRTLEDVRLMKNLKTVCIVAQRISDLAPLTGLLSLEKVEFKHNDIGSVDALVDLEHLTSAGLNGNPVTDLTPLTKCQSLCLLDLCDVQNYDPAFLDAMGDFEFLDISNATDSYLHLAGKHIKELKLNWAPVTGLNCLDEVLGLESLEIGNCSVTDLTPLTSHPALTNLRLSGLAIDDLSILLSLTALERVTVSRDMENAVLALGNNVPFEIIYE